MRWPKLLSLALGVLAATGFPPLHAWPVTLLAMGAFAALIATALRWKSAFGWGWWFGVGHFTLANNWIAHAFTYQEEMPVALGYAAVPLLSLYLAVYPALAALGVWLIARKGGGGAMALAFAGSWIVTEWLRSWVFTGFAWDPLGLALLGPWDRPGIAAILPWTGTYALSGLAVLIGCGVWLALAQKRWIAAGIASALLAAGMYWPVGEGEEGSLRYTLVQPDLRQEELNDASKFEEQFARIASLTAPRPEAMSGPRLVLWPESGVPDYLRDGYPQRFYRRTAAQNPRFARWRIGRIIGEDAMLLTGAVDVEIEAGEAAGVRNVVTAITSDGAIAAGYQKAHLVPYGEYLPLRWLLEPLGASRLVAGNIEFWPGPGPRTLGLGAFGNAGIQICYEIIFSGQVVDPDNRPDYIFNPSNDGWFGAFGPPQHMAQARMRAIEEGLPVLRSTTTGISSVIDARGVVRHHIGMRQAARIDGLVPPAMPPTLFSRLGNGLPLGLALLLLAGSLVASRARRR